MIRPVFVRPWATSKKEDGLVSKLGTSPCPHCDSSNTVRIGQLIGRWLHFCFDCGKRFEAKEERAAEA
jgi:hypothetical protein